MYKAIVCHIDVRDHPNADRLLLGTVAGYQVIVGKDTKSGDLGVFFPTDGQLSREFLLANNLYHKHPDTGQAMGGYFEANGRVKSIKMRGAISDGFWCPLSYLNWTGYPVDKLKPGETFSELKEHEVCRKYITPQTARTIAANKAASKKTSWKSKLLQSKRQAVMFKKHFDTSKLRHSINSIPANSLIILTEKLHGTSGRSCNSLILNQKWWRKKLGLSPKRSWLQVYGSRNVTYFGDSNKGFYKDTTFRKQINDMMVLRKGETIFYEIVGYTDTGSSIMPPHSIEDKALKNKYGDQMLYKYGQKPGTWGVYVYRITMTNEDGDSVELSWEQVRARCVELGLKPVPELARFIHQGDKESLVKKCLTLSEEHSTLDSTHIKEGVCVRVEHVLCDSIFKLKSFDFCELEGIAKSFEDYVDMEEVS